jgi:hypothetical protein
VELFLIRVKCGDPGNDPARSIILGKHDWRRRRFGRFLE